MDTARRGNYNSGEDFVLEYGAETHYLRVHVAHIRAKLEPDPSRPQYVITEPGVGYRLRDPTA